MSIAKVMAELSGSHICMEMKNGVSEIVLPPMCTSDFHHNGFIKLWKLSTLFELGRAAAVGILGLGGMVNHYGGNRSFFVRHIAYVISPEFIQGGSHTRDSSIQIIVSLVSCGNTSLTLRETIRRSDDGHELASAIVRYVYVNLENRKSIQLPESVRSNFPSDSVQKNPPSYQALHIPNDFFRCDFEVQPHHIDRNTHTNQAVYLQFCSDTFMNAVQKGRFKGSTKSMEKPVVTSMDTDYMGESVEGDILTVCTWTDNQHIHNVVYFSISLRNEIIFRCWWTIL